MQPPLLRKESARRPEVTQAEARRSPGESAAKAGPVRGLAVRDRAGRPRPERPRQHHAGAPGAPQAFQRHGPGVAPAHHDGAGTQAAGGGRSGQDDGTEDEGGAGEEEEKGDGGTNVTRGDQGTNLEVAGEAVGPTGREAPALPAAQESFTRGRETEAKGAERPDHSDISRVPAEPDGSHRHTPPEHAGEPWRTQPPGHPHGGRQGQTDVRTPSADNPALRGLSSGFRGDPRARSVPGQPWWCLRDRSGPTALRSHTAGLQPQPAAQSAFGVPGSAVPVSAPAAALRGARPLPAHPDRLSPAWRCPVLAEADGTRHPAARFLRLFLPAPHASPSSASSPRTPCFSPAPCADATSRKVGLCSYQPAWPSAPLHPARPEPAILPQVIFQLSSR